MKSVLETLTDEGTRLRAVLADPALETLAAAKCAPKAIALRAEAADARRQEAQVIASCRRLRDEISLLGTADASDPTYVALITRESRIRISTLDGLKAAALRVDSEAKGLLVTLGFSI